YPETLYKQPATEFVAQFIGRGTFIDGSVVAADSSGLVVRTAQGLATGITSPNNITRGEVRLFFRPEDVVTDCPDSKQETGLTLHGKVHEVYFQGASTMAEVSVPGLQGLVLFDVSDLVRHRTLANEEDVSLYVPGSKIHVFVRQ